MQGSIGGSSLIDANYIMEKAQLGDKMKIADLGCGASGHFVFAASKYVGMKGIVYAVDILKTVLATIDKRARIENYPNVKTIWSDLEIFGATKIESGSLDIALLINTLYQSHKRAEIIREGVRMLKKGGKLIVAEWNMMAAPLGPPATEKVKKDLLETAAKKLGLNLEEEFVAGQFHYGLIFVKL